MASSAAIITLLTKSLRPRTPWNPATATRFFSTGNSDSLPKQKPKQRFVPHPFQTGGPLVPVTHVPVKGGLLLRVTMPGVGQDGLKLHLENNTVFFEGKGEAEHESEEGRGYKGSFEVFGMNIKVAKLEPEMRDGILRVLVRVNKIDDDALLESDCSASF